MKFQTLSIPLLIFVGFHTIQKEINAADSLGEKKRTDLPDTQPKPMGIKLAANCFQIAAASQPASQHWVAHGLGGLFFQAQYFGLDYNDLDPMRMIDISKHVTLTGEAD